MCRKTSVIEVRMLEKIYKMLVEARMLYEMEILDIYEAWREVDLIHARFYKKI
jgi:ACT domain-containing protein